LPTWFTVRQGPIPGVNSSAITLAALCAGLALSTSSTASQLIGHPAWFSAGTMGCFVMYYFRDWAGHAGGLAYGLFLMSILPKMLQESAFRGGARVYFLAWLVATLLILADVRICWFQSLSISDESLPHQVWATAYAFVPGGVYMRERTNL
jgi:hypothetical protein